MSGDTRLAQRGHMAGAPATRLETVVSSTLRTVVFEFAAYEVSHIHYPDNDSINWSNILAKEIVKKKKCLEKRIASVFFLNRMLSCPYNMYVPFYGTYRSHSLHLLLLVGWKLCKAGSVT